MKQNNNQILAENCENTAQEATFITQTATIAAETLPTAETSAATSVASAAETAATAEQVSSSTEVTSITPTAATATAITPATATAATATASTTAVTPYYKSYSLPDGIVFSRDLRSEKVVYNFPFLSPEDSMYGLGLSLIAASNNSGQLFGTNLDELIVKSGAVYYYEDSNRDRHLMAQVNNVISYGTMTYYTSAPSYVTNMFTAAQLSAMGIVSYLFDGSVARGFNSVGKLVFISDLFKRNIYIERNSVGNVSVVYERAGTTIVYKYNFTYSGNKILSVTRSNSSGTLTETLATFTYDGLLYTGYTTEKCGITINYTGNMISEIQSDNGYYITYSSNVLKVRSSLTEIPSSASSTILPAISQWTFTLANDVMKIKDLDNNREIFAFLTDETLHCIERCGKVTQAEKSTFTANGKIETRQIANKSCLNKTVYESFTFSGTETATITYNTNGLPSKKIVTNCDSDFIDNYTIAYSYNNAKISGEITTVKYKNDENAKTSNKLYLYNSNGQLFKRETFTQADKDTIGKMAEEYEYDDYGNVTAVYSFNTEEETWRTVKTMSYDSLCRLLTVSDERGKITTYAYSGLDRKPVKATLPDGAVINFTESDTVTDRVKEYTISSLFAPNKTAVNKTVYTKGELTQMSDGNDINFKYDDRRRLKQVLLGTESYDTYTYSSSSTTETVQKTNAKNETFKITMGKDGQSAVYSYGGASELTENYDGDGNLISRTDGITGDTETFSYMNFGSPTGYALNTNEYTESYGYTEYGEISSITMSGAVNGTYGFGYTSDYRTLTSVSYGDVQTQLAYDKQWRMTGRTTSISGTVVQTETITPYQYTTDGGTVMCVTALPARLTFTSDSKSRAIVYDYDDRGNISKITDGSNVTNYTYDLLNRLLREDNKALGTSVRYMYDTVGNLTDKLIGEYTTETVYTGTKISYTYTDGRMSAYNGQACVYDSIGNPTTYRDTAATWKGRRMLTYGTNTFTYDGKGRRTSKNSITYTYDSADRLIKSSDGFEFFYDDTGVAGFKYNTATYIYRKDAQGNILSILDSTGAIVVEYVYDAWGNHTVTGTMSETIGALNPFRYRGYYFDTETGFYFLQTRYYDPEVGRFLNMDSIAYADSTTFDGLNLYAYCLNNPVTYVDPNGTNIANQISDVLDIMQLIMKMGIGVINGLSLTLPNVGRGASKFASSLSSFGTSASSVFSVTSYGLIAVSNIIDGVAQDKSTLNIITDTVFDCSAVALGSFIGSAIGSIIPGVGNIVGGFIGAGLGAVYMYFSSSSVIQDLKDAFYTGVNTIITDIQNAVNSIGNTIERWFRELFK